MAKRCVILGSAKEDDPLDSCATQLVVRSRNRPPDFPKQGLARFTEADPLAGVVTHATEHTGQRIVLFDDPQGFLEFPLGNE